MRIGIIGAMDVEVELLKQQLKDTQLSIVAGMGFCAGSLGAADVVVVRSGIGKVDAAVCAQVLVDHFAVTAIVNTGIAGSLDDELDIGDLVVSTDCVHHDFDASALGYGPGEIPGLGTVGFPASPELRAAALSAASIVAPEVRAHEGRVVSGDQFVSDAVQKRRLVETFGGACCEMEGAAIAQTAWLNGVPFVVVRAISDKAGTEGQTTDYATFERAAALHCAKIVSHMVASL